jgi:ribonuclease-3
MNKIGYQFKNRKLLKTAMTHSSYANEHREQHLQNNERLEFLGDSVLGMITADYMYHHYRNEPEGELTKLRAAVVCEQTLCEIAKEFGIDQEILLGKGEECGGGRQRPSILADATEALIAAIYLDGGIAAAREFVLKALVPKISLAEKGAAFQDYKTMLQEIVQKNRQEVLSYRLSRETGPDHDKRFYVEVLLNSNVFAEGVGRSKKDAEQDAAHKALQLMGQE